MGAEFDSNLDGKNTIEGECQGLKYELRYLPKNDSDPKITLELLKRVAPLFEGHPDATVYLSEALTDNGSKDPHYELKITAGNGGGDDGGNPVHFVYCDIYVCPSDNPSDPLTEGMIMSEVLLSNASEIGDYVSLASKINEKYLEVVEEKLDEKGANNVSPDPFTGFFSSGGSFLGDEPITNNRQNPPSINLGGF